MNPKEANINFAHPPSPFKASVKHLWLFVPKPAICPIIVASKFVKTHPCLRQCLQLPHPWGKRERFVPLNLKKIKNWKGLEKNKILSNLKGTVLEQVNQGLHPGKVWENRIFLYFIGIVDIRKPILRFHRDQHRKRRKSRCRVLGHPNLIEHINVAHECDWFLVKLLRTPTSRFVRSGPCSNF